MTIDKRWLLTGAAVLGAGALGFTIAELRGGDAHPTAAGEAAHAEGEEHAEEGATPARAAEEGFVALTPEQARIAGVTVVSLTRGGGQEIRLSGRVEPSPSARAAVGAPIGGVVERVFVAPGSPVRAGSPIAVIRSAEGAVINAEVSVVRAQADGARATSEAAAAAFAREERLLRAGVIPRQDWEAARATLLQAQAQVRAADAQAQAARARIAASGNPGASGRATVASPISGVVTIMSTAAGGYLAQGATVAEIANPRLVELVFSAPAVVAGRITPGMTITARGSDGQEYPSVVIGVAPDAVEVSGAASVRARPVGVVPPAGSPLSASIVIDSTGGITVPAEAVQTVDGAAVVFVAEARGFRVRRVVAGRTANERTEIVSGLQGSERVAGVGAFLLKAELAKGEAEHTH